LLGSRKARYDWRRALRFGLLSGCFVVLVVIIVAGVGWLAGWGTPTLSLTTLYWLLAIFAAVSLVVFGWISTIELFLERNM